MNDVFGLALLENHGHTACFVRWVNLQVTRIDRQRVQNTDCFPAQVVAPDPAQNGGVIPETPGHHSEVRRSPAQLRTLRQHIPQQLPNSKDQTRLFQGRTP
jgi:hypothetical protein